MGLVEKLKSLVREIRRVKEDNQETRLLIGALLAKNVGTTTTLEESEFKVFSQFGDDGIIQFLLNRIRPAVHTFVEFGVESYEEANTRFLLMHNNWRGLVIDGSPTHIAYIRNSPTFWRYDLTAVNSFVTVENINQILENNGFAGKIGLLSIDIDGNDYWVWQAITVTDADIVIVEYNSLFGAERAVSVPYKPDFYRVTAHYSYLYFGASLPAFCDLAKSKGYTLVGCNQAGNNAYFVKDQLVGSLPRLSAGEAFVEAKFREGRNRAGELTFSDEQTRRREIAGLTVINTRTGLAETI